jgi:hypothetical protein
MYLVAPKFDKWLAEAYAKFKGAILTNSAQAEQFLTIEEEPETSAVPETEAPTVTEAPTQTEPAPEKKGCGSMIVGGAAIIAILATAVVFKKED